MKKYLFALSAVVLAIGFSAFTKPAPAEKAFAAQYFEFIGLPGEEAQPAKWVISDADLSLCTGVNKSCKILVKDTYINGSNQLTLASVPVVSSPTSNLVPDPTAEGSSPSQPFDDIINRP